MVLRLGSGRLRPGGNSLKLVLTLLVRDEEDIIRENVLYHLDRGVDFVIVTDNLSVDRTADILREFVDQGVMAVIREDDDTYAQSRWVTRMARLAKTEHGADWVINSDADEFWWARSGNLKDAVQTVHPDSTWSQPGAATSVRCLEADRPGSSA